MVAINIQSSFVANVDPLAEVDESMEVSSSIIVSLSSNDALSWKHMQHVSHGPWVEVSTLGVCKQDIAGLEVERHWRDQMDFNIIVHLISGSGSGHLYIPPSPPLLFVGNLNNSTMDSDVPTEPCPTPDILAAIAELRADMAGRLAFVSDQLAELVDSLDGLELLDEES